MATPSGEWNQVRVLGRVRPLMPHELATREKSVVSAISNDSLAVFSDGVQQKYKFSHCFGETVTQQELFDQSGIKDLLRMAINGYRASCFAYGQTGSGKTFSMFGEGEDDPSKTGMIPRALRHLFDEIPNDGSVIVRTSFIELYNEKIFDLLSSTRTGLKLRWTKEDGYFPENAFVVLCESFSDIMEVLAEGRRNRAVGSHDLNRDSSRSHALLTVHIEQRDGASDGARSRGRVMFVDLAGSERLRDTNSDGMTVVEAQSINKSLFALGAVISALASRKAKQIPYRDSKLTKLLMDCLGGSSIGMLMACVSPAARFSEETQRTLEYALRAQNITNKPVQNVDPTSALVHELQQTNTQLVSHIRALEYQLVAAGLSPTPSSVVAAGGARVGSSGSRDGESSASSGRASVYGGRRMELPPVNRQTEFPTDSMGASPMHASQAHSTGQPPNPAGRRMSTRPPAVPSPIPTPLNVDDSPARHIPGHPRPQPATTTGVGQRRPLSVRTLRRNQESAGTKQAAHPFSAGARAINEEVTRDDLIGALDRVHDENAELTRTVQDLHDRMHRMSQPSSARQSASTERRTPFMEVTNDLQRYLGEEADAAIAGTPPGRRRMSGIPKPRPKPL